ncbi:MAG: phage major capsid protein [Anaerostipes sp.]|jgi:HK97 family phage major capsid protein|nr:phage major capsid protein [Anaerostipes sp.]
MSIKMGTGKASQKLVVAMRTGDEEKIKAAWQTFQNEIVDDVKADFLELADEKDVKVLQSRGYRQLTSKETKFYQSLIKSAKASNPKQAFADLIEKEAMPTTIIEDVYKDLEDEHKLLGKINFQYVSYLTKWVLNDHTVQKAVWGKITDEITKQIESGFKVVDVDQNKLSAYAIIENGMLDLGPTFIDAYIRRMLKEALALGLEEGIVNGTGINQPIGLIRDVHKGVTVSSTDGYPKKTAVKVTDFTPKSYGTLLGKLAINENKKQKKFTEVTMICNQSDYLTKIMPATTVLNAQGTYVNNLFPFPTDVCISNVLEEGQAIIFLPEEYFFGVGGSKDGVIEYSDEVKFLEDQRAYKIKQYGHGVALDNTTAILLDISELEPAYITVLNKDIPAA